jgi:L-lactate dehydrogenase complex protein LldG
VIARNQILARLRAAKPFLPPTAAAELPPSTSGTVEERIARFMLEAAALGVDCIVESTAADVRRRVASLIAGHQVLSWNSEYLPYDAGGVLVRPTLGNATPDQQALCSIGLTGCDAAIAETGSLVLFSGPGRSRAASLLPPVHIALLGRGQLCLTMAELFSVHAARFTNSAACTIVTGPSRTADIELTLTLGIHGPGRVTVIIGP